MPKFFFCHSPFAVLPKGAVGCIYSFDKPRFFALITAFKDDNSFEDQNAAGLNILFQYNRGDGNKQFYVIEVIQNIDKASTKMPAMLLQAAGWYCNFLDYDDHKKYGKKGTWSYMQDFSAFTKGLQILRMPRLKKYLVSYAGGLKTVNNDEELDTFLTKALKYPEVMVEEGIINSM